MSSSSGSTELVRTPYLLRRRYRFEYKSSLVQGVPSAYPRHGARAPAVPVLQPTPTKPIVKSLKSVMEGVFAYCFDWRERRTDGKVLEARTKVIGSFEKSPNLDSSVSSQDEPHSVITTARSPLCALPRELILHIMSYLTPASLYCLRQTSPLFMVLFSSELFGTYHQQELDPVTRHRRFTPHRMPQSEICRLREILHPEVYCGACLTVKQNGIASEKLNDLRSLMYCHGCKREHARAFFFPDDSPQYDVSGLQTCIGRRGHITVCNHESSTSTTWGHFKNYQACKDLSHYPEGSYLHSFYAGGCGFPRLIVSRSILHQRLPGIFDLGYGWDIPLVEIDDGDLIPLALIRETISCLLKSALASVKTCQHISITKELQDFVHSGICNCFRTRRHISPYRDEFLEACSCGRQNRLECRVCGAVYLWLLFYGHVILSMRYLWRIHEPTSLGWLGLIDKTHYFTEYNKHVFWCETPDCQTNKRGLWETVVKDNMRREVYHARTRCTRGGADSHKGQGITSDDGLEDSWFDVSDDSYTSSWDCRETWKASKLGSLQEW